MTRDEAVKIILMRCGMRQNDKALQEAAVAEMMLAQQTRLERSAFKPWFLLSETESTVTFPTEERIPLPKNFLQEYEEGALDIRDYDDDQEDLPGYVVPRYRPLVKEDYDLLQDRFPAPGHGYDSAYAPQAYAIVNNYITLHPAPQRTYMLRMKYYKKAEVFPQPFGEGAGLSNEWLTICPDWIIGETGAVLAGSYIKDDATAAKFSEQAALARQAIYVEHVARDEANRRRSMGDD
jgi:hypothetical protein